MSIVWIVITCVTGVYEVLSRAIPTVKNISILGTIINWLKKISDAFDNSKESTDQTK
jgi:hypothetical protein